VETLGDDRSRTKVRGVGSSDCARCQNFGLGGGDEIEAAAMQPRAVRATDYCGWWWWLRGVELGLRFVGAEAARSSVDIFGHRSFTGGEWRHHKRRAGPEWWATGGRGVVEPLIRGGRGRGGG
jgi:hypothetical protein